MQLKKGRMPDGTRKSGVHKHCECNGKQLETCVVENSEKENHGFYRCVRFGQIIALP